MFRLLSAVVATAALATASITDCNPASVFRPTQLAQNPDPPVRGQPVVMTVVFNNPGAPVSDGKVETSVSLNGIPFSPSTEALCTNTKCHIATGVNDRSASSTWTYERRTLPSHSPSFSFFPSPRAPAQDHHADQKQPPDRRRKMLVRPQKVQPR